MGWPRNDNKVANCAIIDVMPMLDRDGTLIHYESVGPRSAPAVLLSHGFAATGAMWSSTVAALASDHRCITWDLRGHGDSDSPDDPGRYTSDLALEDMEAILDAESVDRAVLVGHSLGGYLSLRFHHRWPGRTAALVLADTGPGYRNDQARAGWNKMCESYATALEADGFEGLPTASPELGRATHRRVDGLIRAARYLLTQHDQLVVDHLPDVDVPTLVVVGSEDRPFLAGSDYMAHKVPGARKVVIDGAGHAPMISHQQPFEQDLRSFLHSL